MIYEIYNLEKKRVKLFFDQFSIEIIEDFPVNYEKR